MKGSVKIGDIVRWKDCWGAFPEQHATVVGLTVTQLPRDKYGVEVTEVPWFLVAENRVVFNLDTNKWAYGEQIKPLLEAK